MPRYAKRVDANQKGIIRALKAVGCSVVHLSQGSGIPDLLVGWRQQSFLLEVKNPDGFNKVLDTQKEFARDWRGPPPIVVRSSDDALKAIGAI